MLQIISNSWLTFTQSTWWFPGFFADWLVPHLFRPVINSWTPLDDKTDSHFLLRVKERDSRNVKKSVEESFPMTQNLVIASFCMFPVSNTSRKVNKGSRCAVQPSEIQYHKIICLSQDITKSNVRKKRWRVQILWQQRWFRFGVRCSWQANRNKETLDSSSLVSLYFHSVGF